MLYCQQVSIDSENYVASEGAVSQYVLYYQHLPIDREQVTTVITKCPVPKNVWDCTHHLR